MNHDEKKIEEKKLEEVIFLALGETSALFMSQDTRGRHMVMPSEKLGVIGDRIFNFAEQYAEHIRKQTIKECEVDLVTRITNITCGFLIKAGSDSLQEDYVDYLHAELERLRKE